MSDLGKGICSPGNCNEFFSSHVKFIADGYTKIVLIIDNKNFLKRKQKIFPNAIFLSFNSCPGFLRDIYVSHIYHLQSVKFKQTFCIIIHFIDPMKTKKQKYHLVQHTRKSENISNYHSLPAANITNILFQLKILYSNNNFHFIFFVFIFI